MSKKPKQTYPGYTIEISSHQEFKRTLLGGVVYTSKDRQFVLKDPEGNVVLTKFGHEHGSVYKTIRWFERKYPGARFDFSHFDPVTIVRVKTDRERPILQSGYIAIPVKGTETDAELAYEAHLECSKVAYLVADYDGTGSPTLVIPC